MSVIISNGNTTLNTPNGFYRVETHNLSPLSTTLLSVATTRFITVTFANSGTVDGIILALYTTSSPYVDYDVVVEFQEVRTPVTLNLTADTITYAGHGLIAGDKISFSTTGALPTNITSGTSYYVIDSGLTLDVFKVSTTPGGSAVNMTGTQSGVHSVWVYKGSAITLTADQICTGTEKRGTYIVSFSGINYAVDTTANKYQFAISRGAGSSGSWSLKTSDGIAPFYAAWCKNTVSFNNNDCVICKNYVTIDKTATFQGVLGTGDTTNSIAGVICKSEDITADNVCLLIWENPPVSAYTLTLDGAILVSGQSGFRCGSSNLRIPNAKMATIQAITPTLGTAGAIVFRDTFNNASSTSGAGSKENFFFYGEVPTVTHTHLVSNALVGETSFTTTDITGWVNGDQIVIGKQDILTGQGSTTVHTVLSTDGNIVNISSGLASYNRKAGATVIRFNGYGIKLIGVTGYFIYTQICDNLVISGCENYQSRLYMTGSGYYFAQSSSNTSQYLIEDCSWRSTSTSSAYFIYGIIIPPKGAIIQRIYTFRGAIISTVYAYYRSGWQSDTLEMSNCHCLSNYSTSNNSSAPANAKFNIHDNTFENSYLTYQQLNFSGLNSVYKNNVFWGGGTAVYISNDKSNRN